MSINRTGFAQMGVGVPTPPAASGGRERPLLAEAASQTKKTSKQMSLPPQAKNGKSQDFQNMLSDLDKQHDVAVQSAPLRQLPTAPLSNAAASALVQDTSAEQIAPSLTYGTDPRVAPEQTIYPQRALPHGCLSQRPGNMDDGYSVSTSKNGRPNVLPANWLSVQDGSQPRARQTVESAPRKPAGPESLSAESHYSMHKNAARPVREKPAPRTIENQAGWTRTHVHHFAADGRLEIWIRDYETSDNKLEKLVRNIVNSYRQSGKPVSRIILNGRPFAHHQLPR